MPAIASELRGARLRLERWAMRERPRTGRRRWLPRPTVRLRLTLLYGSLFLVAGAFLLGITYGLAAKNVSDNARQSVVLREGKAIVTRDTGPIQLPPSGGGQVFFQQTTAGNVTAVPAGVPSKLRPTAIAIQRAASESINAARSNQLSALLTESLIALVIMAFVSIGLGWLVAGRVLAPVRTMNLRMRQISEHNLHERLSLAGHDDELKELGDTFDELLGRLERAFESQRLFVANASHELRTPVTVERALVEVALADPDATVESLRETCSRVLVAGEQQERTIEALLTLARSQRGLAARQSVDLATVAAEAVSSARGSDVVLKTRLAPAATFGDPGMVERLVANLVDNAVHHNRPQGWARVTTAVLDGRPTLTVANSGAVIAPDDTAGLLEPFRRLNGNRTRHGNGVGLGLSIVGAIATAHGADLQVVAPADGGLVVTVGFPADRGLVRAVSSVPYTMGHDVTDPRGDLHPGRADR